MQLWATVQIRDERTHGRRAVARKEAKGKRMVARSGKTRTHCSVVSKGRQQQLVRHR